MLKFNSFVLVAFLLSSCYKVDCKGIAESRRQKECNIIVEKAPESGRWFEIKGVHPKTLEKARYKDMETWYVHFYKNIEIGDTVVKRQGELKFYIHKKDTVLTFPYTCEGYIYE